MDIMKHVRDRLLGSYFFVLGMPALVVVLCEFFGCDIAMWDNAPTSRLYIFTVVTILLVLAVIPLTLRVFKFRRIAFEVYLNREVSYYVWSNVRIGVLGLLLVTTTLLYYVFGMEPRFAHLSVVVLLAYAFVFPTLDKCQGEYDRIIYDYTENYVKPIQEVLAKAMENEEEEIIDEQWDNDNDDWELEDFGFKTPKRRWWSFKKRPVLIKE